MSDVAIHIEGVTKSFRRFAHPGWRALDAFGFRVPRSRYDIFAALRGVDIEIGRGERVALIGRNGAGKSTLLRLISGQMQPDAGSIALAGQVQALMELGTGFHPDFTGTENIRAALALQGASGPVLRRLVDEIIDFTELEGFIERPVREYSAGMYARLAFAVATSIEPEILIVDEILGAGDAYFVGKSIQRMKRLTDGGATVLFVSHDMSSVQLLCDRAVWIDHGKVRRDGDILSVSKAYLAAVREDEEVRTRARSMSLTRHQAASLNGQQSISLYRLVGENGTPPRDPVAVAALRFGAGARLLGEIAPDRPYDGSGPILDATHMNWRGPEKRQGRNCWLFGDFGGLYGHAPWQLAWPSGHEEAAWIELDLLRGSRDPVVLEQYDEVAAQYVRLTVVAAGDGGGWETVRTPVNSVAPAATAAERVMATLDLQTLAPDDRYGTGEVAITAFAFVDGEGQRRHTLISGEPAAAVMLFDVAGDIIDPVAVIAVYRPDGTCAMQVVSNRHGMHLGRLSGQGVVRVDFEPLYLGPGDFIVSVALFKELNIASRVEPEAYDLHDRCYALKVLPPAGIGMDLGTVNQPASWLVVK